MSGKKLLLVMRHAKSSWKTNEPDRSRPLSGRGVRDAVVAGQTIARFAPELVWCSAAARAQQTWQSARMGGATCPDVRVEERLYEADADDLASVLRTTRPEANTVLLIGHEPAVSDLVLSLTESNELTPALHAKYPTAALSVLRFTGEWDALAERSAELSAFEIPRG